MIYDKLIKKIILVLIFSLISCIIFTSTTYAADKEENKKILTIDDMMSAADGFLNTGEENAIDKNALRETSNYIYNTLLVIAVAIAVIVGAYLGIKFMLESAEDKAKIKEALIPFIVGCFIIFGAFGIWKIAVDVGEGITGDSKGSSTTYTKKADGKLYCDACGDVLSTKEQRNGKCSCGKNIKGI